MDSRHDHEQATTLLAAASRGDAPSADLFFSLLYGELRRLAGAIMRDERCDHTLGPTALVHEAWVKLVGGAEVRVEDRDHFMRMAARAMRRILTDHARGLGRVKRGGEVARVSLNENLVGSVPAGVDVIALDELLERLAAQDADLVRLVELRVFAGLSMAECATLLGLSKRSAERRWTFARTWLGAELGGGDDADG